MKVILLQDVKSVGKKGDMVEISEGYARNFILPKKLGVEANNVAMNNLKLQKNGTPLENPISSGGSPIGVRQPPILEIRKMKKTIICVLFFLHEFI